MTASLPRVVLARHGETAWTVTHQHTGRTDLPLTARGEEAARRVGAALRETTFVEILTSPLKRASRTCELAGFGGRAKVDPDLVEWDYGKFEGRTTAEIQAESPDWDLFRDGCPGGESPAEIGARADRVVARLRAIDGDVAVFSSAHFLRVLTARWLGLPASAARYWVLGTASLSTLGYEHDRSEPVVARWNLQP
ncbi:MAG TPA: histidine phosphatase family protein [Myxococcota bacterium]|nr:histidine phosphatase family protein [Myxococcota bacterium]